MQHRIGLFILVFAFSTTHAQTKVSALHATKEIVSAVPTHKSSSRSITSLEYSLNALLWQQRSGEYQALCYQAFSLAKLKLQEKIALRKNGGDRLAIVTDIDETILDNSPQQATDLLHHTTYTEKSWLNWTSTANAGDIPGAVAFFQWADKMGVQCFYVSNRSSKEKEATIKNLALRGFPQADELHVMMKDSSSDKEPRREKIRQQYTIALLLGDNLNDFDKMFYKESWFTRCNLVRDNKDLFGDVFIILPNPVYGDWESAIWEYKNVSPEKADKIKHEALFVY
ncbi:MAG: 5'-nucleotidase, lipoprotein e(P4) family [Ferruginibacter sp.]